MKTISRISAGSVFKVAVVIYGVLFAIFGCIFLVIPSFLGFRALDAVFEEPVFPGSTIAILVGYVIGVIIYALLIGVIAALGAVIYNWAAGRFGGIEVEVE